MYLKILFRFKNRKKKKGTRSSIKKERKKKKGKKRSLKKVKLRKEAVRRGD